MERSAGQQVLTQAGEIGEVRRSAVLSNGRRVFVVAVDTPATPGSAFGEGRRFVATVRRPFVVNAKAASALAEAVALTA